MQMHFNIELSEALKEWVERRMADAGFATPSDLVHDILRKEQARDAMSKFEDHLEQIIDSAEPTPMTPQDWENIRAEGRRRLEAFRKS